jgi:hypothetical protein
MDENLSLIEQLKLFMQEAEERLVSSRWIHDENMKVYVRKGRRSVYPGQMSITLDIATVEVDEDKQGQGLWTTFLEKAHELNPWEATYIENVLNPVLAESLIRHGWMIANSNFGSHSFFMPKDSAKYHKQQYLKQKYVR